MLEEALTSRQSRWRCLDLSRRREHIRPSSVSDYQAGLRAGEIWHSRAWRHCRAMPLKRLDLALAPGLGFDVSGRRLGRGQGYYDRLLAEIAGAKCGVAFDEQIVGNCRRKDTMLA